MKYWEIIVDNLSKAGWSWGWVSAVDCEGRTIWIVDAYRDDGKRFVVRADEKTDELASRKRVGSRLRDQGPMVSTRDFCQNWRH